MGEDDRRMLSLLQIYASVLSLVWLLLSVSLFSPVLFCVFSSPPTPSALHRYCNGDFAWVRYSHHLPWYGSNGGVRRSFCTTLRSEGVLFQALLHHRLPFPVMQSKIYHLSFDSGEAYVSQQQIQWSLHFLILPFEVDGSLLQIPLINVGSVIAGPIGFRTEVTEILMSVSNTSSDPSSNLSLWFDSISDRLCSFICKSEKSASAFISPLVGRLKRSSSLNPTGVCKLSRCTSRQDGYTLITPFVLNLNSKFIVDIGAVHGLNSVMVNGYLSSRVCFRRVSLRSDCSFQHCTSRRGNCNLLSPLVLNLVSKLFFVNFGSSLYGTDSRGIVTVSFASGYCRKDPDLDRTCYRTGTARALGVFAKDKHTDIISFGLLTGVLVDVFPELFDSAFSGRILIDVYFGICRYLLAGLQHKHVLNHQQESPECHRIVFEVEATANVLLHNLRRTPKSHMGLNCPQSFIPTGHEPIINTPESKRFQVEKSLTYLLVTGLLSMDSVLCKINCWFNFYLHSHIELGVCNVCIVSSAFLLVVSSCRLEDPISERKLY